MNLLLYLILLTQSQEVEMADLFRSGGKIYVLIGIIIIILAGIIFYLIRLERKIARFEKELYDKKVNP